ncbi:UPF0669 protein C6orf120 homolog [Ceratina calcarata]|uniref:UPF0669 protein C6orf120 homolog n=1 Tax=Ceratina calcarata TaxID=156304 RepID=A0AAJ7IYT8_9HYME|nr:UPF0669 protein C6orf120 homolog [Ceratina calcarata]
MRNIFIFVILCLSFALAYENKLLHYITDEVTGSSYKYYSLSYDGFIKIILISEIGDADLYVSQITTKPTFDPDQNCLQSITCGDDIILIPDSFKRPVSIGIYGHPSHENSTYVLLVYQTSDTEHVSYEKSSQADGNENQGSSVSTFIMWYLLDILFHILF